MTHEPGTESTTPQIEVTVAADVDTVWSALRDEKLVKRWHGWEYDGLDEEVRLIYGTPDEVDDERRVLVVQEGDRFTLHPVDGGTVVRITRAPRGVSPQWDAYYDDITEGWTTFLQQLRFGIERHGLAERRTLFLSGRLREPAAGVAAAAGLAEAAAAPVGSAWSARAASGDDLSGTVWAHAPRQRMLTVDQAGDGLLVLADQPVTAERPDGGAMLLLTAYGLDAAAFADLERRWTAWWDGARQPDDVPAVPTEH